MSFQYEIGSFAVAGPFQTINLSVVTDPKILIVWTAGKTGWGMNANLDWRFSMGSRAGSGLGSCIATYSRHNQGTSECRRSHHDALLLELISAGGVSILQMQFSSWNSSPVGFTVGYLIYGSPFQVFYLVLGGSKVSAADVNFIAPAGSPPYNQTFNHGLGVVPNAQIFKTAGWNGTPGGQGTEQRTSLGFVGSDMANSGNATAWSQHGQAFSNCHRYQSHVGAGGTLHAAAAINTSSAIYNGYRVTNRTASQCQVTHDIAASGQYQFCTSLKVPRCKVLGITQPSSNGNQIISGVGFRPDVVLMHNISSTTNSTVHTQARFGAGIAARNQGEFCLKLVDQDNQDVSNCANGAWNNRFLSFNDHAGTEQGNATITAWGDDGLTLSWSNCDGNQRRFNILLLGFVVPVNLAEGMRAGDTLSAEVSTPLVSVNLSEGGLTGDTLSPLLSRPVNLSEGGLTGDTLLVGMPWVCELQDSILTGETLSPLLSLPVNLAEGMQTGEDQGWVVNAICLVALMDGMQLADTLSPLLSLPVNLSEGNLTGDTLSPLLASFVNLAEGMQTGETLSSVIVVATALTDGMQTGETLSSLLSLPVNLAEGMQTGETLSPLLASFVNLAEGNLTGDQTSTVIVVATALTDDIRAGDAILGVAIILVDFIQFTDLVGQRSEIVNPIGIRSKIANPIGTRSKIANLYGKGG